jgi:hypothetical protein
MVHGEKIMSMGIIATILLWILGAGLALYLIAAEFIDTIGRLKIIEERWPNVWRAINNRPFRLVLLVFLVLLFAKDLSERMRGPRIPNLLVTVQAPKPPIVQITQAAVPKSKSLVKIEQNGNGNQANPGTIAAPINQGPCSVVQNGGSGNSASPICAPPERKLSYSQKYQIVLNLRSSCPFPVAVRPIPGNAESMKYADELVEALRSAGCIPQRPRFLIDTAASYGVSIAVHDLKNVPPGADSLAFSLTAAQITWSKEEVDPVEPGVTYIMVGLNGSRPQ